MTLDSMIFLSAHINKQPLCDVWNILAKILLWKDKTAYNFDVIFVKENKVVVIICAQLFFYFTLQKQPQEEICKNLKKNTCIGISF